MSLLESIPSDLKLVLLTAYLEVKDISNLSRTNRYFRNVVYGPITQDLTNRLWITLYRRDLSEIRSPDKQQYRDEYIKHGVGLNAIRRPDVYRNGLIWSALSPGFEQMLKRHIDIFTDLDKQNCMSCALRYGHTDIIDYLIAMGVPYKAWNHDIRATANRGFIDLVKRHVEIYNDELTYINILDGAAEGRQLEMFKIFYYKATHCSTGLLTAIYAGYEEFFDYALSVREIDLDTLNVMLTVASRADNRKFVDKLIKCGANDYHRAMKGALKNRNYDLLGYLLDLQKNTK
jgi:hypothetical protein